MIRRVAPLWTAAVFTMSVAACSSGAPPIPTTTVAPPATAGPTATASPTAAKPTATPGPTQITYDAGAAIPSGTLTLSLSAMNTLYSTNQLAAPANTPFVIHFTNAETSAANGPIINDHNVSIQTGETILFNPLPPVKFGRQADYFITAGLSAGTYQFVCIVHPRMRGTLTIG